jgi:CobQ-like glutamine amidotransferase family enzyme
MKLHIAHLYPELLNIYGDKGNVTAFLKRCLWRDIQAEITEINPGDQIDPELYDFYFIGGGQDTQQIAVADELQKQKDILHKAADNGAVFLAICGGYQLLGHYYKPHSGDKLPGISILDAYTVAGNVRYIGNVTVKTDIPYTKIETLVGFENHSGLTYLQGDTKPLGTVNVGNGNNGKDKTEGAVFKNVFGTYLHGSLLPKNPHFTDYLITLALERRYGKVQLPELTDDIELLAHKKAVNKKY